MSLLERVKEHPVTNAAVGYASLGWSFVQVHLWPVFSAGMVLGAVALIAAAQEKQTIADSLFGVGAPATRRDKDAIANAAQLFDEEVQASVKRDVWKLPAARFREEYELRHGN